MGIFTDVYNVSAAVGKPVAGILRYGAKQADTFVNDFISNDDKDKASNESTENTSTPMGEVHGVVVVRRMEDLTGAEIAKMYKLVAKKLSPEEIASIVSSDNREITPEAVVDASEKLT